MKYLDIFVMISPARGENFQVSAKSADGGEGNSDLKLPFRLGELSSALFGASSAARGMSVGEVPTERLLSVEAVGVQLFDALFSGETREVLSRTEDVAKRNPDKTGVRIRLSMNLAAEGMAEVASLPWELMRRRISSHGRLATSAMPSAARFIDRRMRTPVLSGLRLAASSALLRTSRVSPLNSASNSCTPTISTDNSRSVGTLPALIPRAALEAPKIEGDSSASRNGSLSSELPSPPSADLAETWKFSPRAGDIIT